MIIIRKVPEKKLNWKSGSQPNVMPLGVVSPAGETICGVETPLLATPLGECRFVSRLIREGL